MGTTNCMVTFLPLALSHTLFNRPFSTRRDSHLAHVAFRVELSGDTSSHPDGRCVFFRLSRRPTSLSSCLAYLTFSIVHPFLCLMVTALISTVPSRSSTFLKCCILHTVLRIRHQRCYDADLVDAVF